jgi:SAM-dependent methyltransferase
VIPTTCPLCAESRYEPVFRYHQPDRYEGAVGVTAAGYARQWGRCGGCHFAYARYSRDPDLLDRLYDEAYRDAASAWRGESAEDIFRRVIALPAHESETLKRCTWIKTTLARLAEAEVHALPDRRPWRLLDVGGATGVFAYLFTDDDWRAEIIDPGLQGRFITQHGIGYHQRRFDGEFRDGPYDLVSMVYVLEHVHDPAAVVQQAHAVLSESGLLYVEVPDEIAFEAKPQEDDIFNACHLWMFGPTSLVRLLSSCEFDPLELRRIRTQRGHYALTVLARRV